MRISWGNKLLLVFAAFGGMISFMVYRCMQTPVDLVAKEYYKDELSYQQVIDARQKTLALSTGVTLRQAAEAITVTLPQEMRNTGVKGSIQFYCPADAGRDRRFALQTDSAASQYIAAGIIKPGRYTVRVQWESNGVRYFEEKPFVVL
ncbi:FixH family protein [Flavitalea sp. BT771]|uniref:FixH family protein n=1 Tax=Flavitalea sp. BT771 TaxID=3063329 RepID=UPI0026E2CDD0|nr:FixH family protein [Flavitalea sp. BT771]MDO6429478.1 FixH family protein [Flavitalea sp. BT771]MDV6218394.1 FixH family protein [Flavitalea sp. BT771]